jgi:Fic family protein
MEGRKPKNHSEQMIVNNHETMRWIEEKLKNEELSIGLLRELHKKITFNTIDNKHCGVFRETLDENGQPLIIKPWDQKTVTYIAPPKEFVAKELIKFIDFANDKDDSRFIHPLIKAIMLHFWIGFLHPFEDGNGRLARIVFYWYMLRKNYWAFSYVSLSKYILKSPMQYSMAYIYSEQDENDLNYFIHYNVEKLQLARYEFAKYIKQKILENKGLNDFVAKSNGLNIRQIRLLNSLFNNEQKFTTLVEYKSINAVIGKITSVSDLKRLVTEGYLKKIRSGRNIFYYPTDKIRSLFR